MIKPGLIQVSTNGAHEGYIRIGNDRMSATRRHGWWYGKCPQGHLHQGTVLRLVALEAAGCMTPPKRRQRRAPKDASGRLGVGPVSVGGRIGFSGRKR